MAVLVDNPGMELRVYNIPEGLHKQFKILCVQEGITMNQKIIELMRQAVEKGKPTK